MIDSYGIKKSVIEWFKIIETKIFVDDVMLLQMKITLTIWQHKNILSLRANGCFIQISKVLILCHWGIDLISSRHCLLCNDCNKKQEEEPHVPPSSYKHKQWEARSSSSTWWNWQGSRWTSYPSESQEGDTPSIEWTERPVACSILQASSKNSHEFNLFWYRLIVYSWRRSTVTDGRCKDNTSKDPFSRCKCATTWLKISNDDHRIQSDGKYYSELQNPEGKKSVLGISSAWWNRARNQWQRDHQDPEHLQHSAHEHWHVSAQFSFLLVRFLSSWFTLHHMAQGCCAFHLIHAWSVRFSFDFESSIPFYFLIFSFFRHFFHYLEGRSKPVHSAWKGMDSLDDSYLLTLLVKTIHKENGTELQSKWCWHLQRANTQFSDPRVLCPEEPMEIRLKLFSAQLLRQSAQYLRSSCRFVRRMWHLPW